MHLHQKKDQNSLFGAVGLTLSLTFITAFILGATFVLALCYCLPRRRRSRRDPSAAQEVTEAAVIYDLPTDLVRLMSLIQTPERILPILSLMAYLPLTTLLMERCIGEILKVINDYYKQV